LIRDALVLISDKSFIAVCTYSYILAVFP